MLCSLMNTAMHSQQASVAQLMGSMAGKLPYNHLMFKVEDPHSTLVGTCLQTLCVLLDFQSGTARDAPVNSEGGQSYAPTTKTNAFRYFIAKLVRMA